MSTAAERKIKNSTQSWLVLGDTFEIDTQYRVIDYLGAGAYGVVCSAQDQANGNKLVAIKKCKKLFQSHTMAKRILREIRLLRLINHDNVVKIVNILKPTKNSEFTDIYIVFEIMETDLAQIIRSQQVRGLFALVSVIILYTMYSLHYYVTLTLKRHSTVHL